jgi:phage terminase large subunit-like protein
MKTLPPQSKSDDDSFDSSTLSTPYYTDRRQLWAPDRSHDELLGELDELIEALAYVDAGVEPIDWQPQAHQIPPVGDDWWGWLLIGGRNAGKSAAICAEMNKHAESDACFGGKMPHRMGIIAPTLGDAMESVVYGDAGLLAHNPRITTKSQTGGTFVFWPNGSRAKLFGTNTMEAVDRLRSGGNRCFDACEEIAAWRYLKAAMEHMELGLRKGTSHWVGATTPKARPTIRKLDADPKVVKSRATSDDNKFADPDWLARIHDRFDNTRQGLQEVKGLILDDVEGALWTMEQVAVSRTHDLPRIIRVVVCVDPSWGTQNDECGIIIVGLGSNRKCYVLGDLSCRNVPAEWGLVAGRAYLREWHGVMPDRILAERNFQGEQVKLVMTTVEEKLKEHIIFDLVNASQGKRLRAEPVQGLYAQGRVLHYAPAQLDALEFQMTNWVPPQLDGATADKGDPPEPIVDDDGMQSSTFSPDRLDAMVYGVTHLLLDGSTGQAKLSIAQGRISRGVEKTGAAALPPGLRRVVQKQLRHG